ncbi:50S ribosomal protein L29 [Rhodocaloribacter sp.]
MKAKEIRDLSTDEIRERIREEEEQLSQLHFQHAIAELPNPMVLREKRRLVARLTTILKEKEQAVA